MVLRMCSFLFQPRLTWMSQHLQPVASAWAPRVSQQKPCWSDERGIVTRAACLCWIRSLEGGNNKSLASPSCFEGNIGESMKQCLTHSQRLAHGSWSHLSKCLFQSSLTHSPLATSSNPAPSPFLYSFLLQTLQRCCLDLCWPTLQPLCNSEMIYSEYKIHTKFQSQYKIQNISVFKTYYTLE